MKLHRWKDIKHKPPKLWRKVADFVWGGYRQGGICGAYHFVRCHLWNRYHIINLAGFDDYEWGWLETDDQIEMCIWKSFVDFVEQQEPDIGKFKTPEEYWPDTELDDLDRAFLNDRIQFEAKVRGLYNYWTKERPVFQAELKRLLDEAFPDGSVLDDLMAGKLNFDKYNEAKDRFESLEEKRLLQIVKLRKRLWT